MGELAPAEYAPGRRLLGAYSFLGDMPRIAIDVFRNPSYALTPAIIERATFKTLLSADGNSQTQADFQLRTKALYLEVALPKDATLWSAVLDGAPLKPQKKAGVLLLGLPPGTEGKARALHLVYEAPVAEVLRGGKARLVGPKLRYRASADAKDSSEIPLVNVQWKVTVPAGYAVISTDGTLEPESIQRPTPAPLVVAGALYEVSAGFVGPFFSSAREAGRRAPAENQLGLAMQNDADGRNSASAKPSDGSGRDDVMAWGVDAKPRVQAQDNTIGGLAEKRDGAEAPSPVVLAPAAAAPPAGPVAPPPPTAPPTTPPSTTTFGGVISGPLPSIVTPGTEAKPEPAKPAEPALENESLPSSGSGDKKGGGEAGKQVYRSGKLLGVSSLKIDIQQAGGDAATRHGEAPADENVVTFTSLGDAPEVVIMLADGNCLNALSWAAGAIAFLAGMAITFRPVRQKFALVLVLLLASALLPLAWDTLTVALICNAVFYAASLLVPYYLLVGLLRWIVRGVTGIGNRWLGRAATAAAVATAFALTSCMQAVAQDRGLSASAPEPVVVPDDALIVPYDVKAENGIEKADHLLVPFDRYVELWNQAHPDKKLDAHPSPLPYALSGASYNATLEGDETLNVTGKMQINVLAEGYVSIPLGLRNGVLAKVMLDGKPAQMKIVTAVAKPAAPSKAANPVARNDSTLFLLQLTGKGTHKLELEARLKLARMGGWRGTAAALPAAPAATMTFRIPQPQTEVRLGQVVDRRSRETTRPDEAIETALGPGGALQLQWRPKVAEAQVDRGLTVQSNALLDIEEDGLRMAVELKLEFRRGQRDGFTLGLPADYMVEKVAGGNVRGWEARRAAGKQTVEISLLKTAKDSEQISLFLARSGRVGAPPLDTFSVPFVTVSDAALASGQVTIRRSVLLDVRTVQRKGLTRIDLGPLPDLSAGPATEESVLAVRPYEAYRFPTLPPPDAFLLTAAPIAADVTAEAQTRVAVNADQPRLESRIVFHVGRRKIYRLEVAVPDDLAAAEVILPAAGQWTIEKQGKRSVLRATLAQGVEGDAALVLRGKLAALDARQEMPLPQLEVLGVKREEGDIAVQADPAFNVEARELRNAQETERQRVDAWLDAPLRDATRVALRYSGGAYSGRLRLVARKPEVVCDTITNVKVTDRAIEETIMLNYEIRNAGVRELTFLLPASMRDARISTPMLRRKTVAPADPKNADGPLRVRLELQGDAMNDLRVLVENDRLLPSGSSSYSAPLPSPETAGGAADFLLRQFVVLENTNPDELTVEPLRGMEEIRRQQREWQTLCERLHTNNLYKAYLVQPGAGSPRLSFHLVAHEELQTAGRVSTSRRRRWLSTPTGRIGRKWSSRSTTLRNSSWTWSCPRARSCGRSTWRASR